MNSISKNERKFAIKTFEMNFFNLRFISNILHENNGAKNFRRLESDYLEKAFLIYSCR